MTKTVNESKWIAINMIPNGTKDHLCSA